jgi:SH3 domain-containing YSC84-like protein 1
MKPWVLTAVVVLAAANGASAALSASEKERLANAARITQAIKNDIPEEYWTRSRCAVVIPDLKKAAFIVGGEFGKGVMSCRSGDGWSAPVFMQLAKGSWGFQAGAQQVDLVMLVMNESGVQKLLNNKVTLGADASVAAGPIGRHGSVGTDAQLTAEILSYSRAQGLFAGIDLSGGVLRPDDDANRNAYGATATARTILASREISAPPEATVFLAALGSGAPPVTTPTANTGTTADAQAARSTPPAPRATTTPTTDDDVRAQATQMQQTLDRILADASPSPTGATGTGTAAPTGTTGTASASGTVTVDRARLMQLRQQLDALLAALNRR